MQHNHNFVDDYTWLKKKEYSPKILSAFSILLDFLYESSYYIKVVSQYPMKYLIIGNRYGIGLCNFLDLDIYQNSYTCSYSLYFSGWNQTLPTGKKMKKILDRVFKAEESRRKTEEIIGGAKQEVESESASILNNTQKQIKTYESLYKKNLNKAVDFVIQKLVGE